MNRHNYICCFLILMLFWLTGCEKWLDVRPEDKFTEKQIYSLPQGFADALNGIYLNHGSTAMYGGELTITGVDILAKLYAANNSANQYRTLYTNNYSDASAQRKIEAYWANYYKSILNVNKFLENLDTYGVVLEAKTLNLYKGEAKGLRAFYYFDLLRLFTPNFTKDSLSAILPYYDKSTFVKQDFLPSKEIMNKIIADLQEAEALLLTSDIALTQAQVSKKTGATNRDSRNYRMNYYAVKALQARVNLWRGDRASALNAAKLLISNQAKFPWTELSDLQISDPSRSASNRIFGTEMIMGVENPSLFDLYASNFISGLQTGILLAPNANFLNNTVFEGVSNDYRRTYQWTTSVNSPLFTKYEVGATTSYNNYRTVPLLKMGEMYLIAAECESTVDAKLSYLNRLRTKRNLPALGNATSLTDISTNILKEYYREFYGEGQLFFYYKRNQTALIVNGGTNTTTAMSDMSYTLPVPFAEISQR